jgi:hypothetical protein
MNSYIVKMAVTEHNTAVIKFTSEKPLTQRQIEDRAEYACAQGDYILDYNIPERIFHDILSIKVADTDNF